MLPVLREHFECITPISVKSMNMEGVHNLQAGLEKGGQQCGMRMKCLSSSGCECRRDKLVLNWPGGAASRRSVRAVAKLSPLKTLMSSLGDKSLRPHLDALLDLLMQVSSSGRPCQISSVWKPLEHATTPWDIALQCSIFSDMCAVG